MIREIVNKIILAGKEILVFLSPYVIPIPKESILRAIAKRINSDNVKTSIYIK